MPRPKTGDKRAAILRAATETIADEGMGASTAKIAKAAGVAEGSLFRYFADKDTLLNELYLELKMETRVAMMDGFPTTSSLRRRLEHIWKAYVGWGMAAPAKRKTMLQLNVSDRITTRSRKEARAGAEEASEAMLQVVERGKLRGMPPGFASDLLLAMAEATMALMSVHRAEAKAYCATGFEAFWSATAKK